MSEEHRNNENVIRYDKENTPIDSITQLEEKTYTASEVARTLDISTSSLRKYCPALEALGYKIERSVQDRRVFSQNNVNDLREMRELISDGLKLETAAERVVHNNVFFPQPPSVTENNAEKMEEFLMIQEERALKQFNEMKEFYENKTDELLKVIEDNKKLYQQQIEESEKNFKELSSKLDKIVDNQSQSFLKRLFNRQK